jgi:tetratricopeptide (TPR) repeat protein
MRRLFLFALVCLCACLCAWAQAKIPANPEQWAQEGSQIAPGAARQLESLLESNPQDFYARGKLLGYYYYQWTTAGEGPARAARRRHILWLVKNHPEHPLATAYEAVIEPKGTSLADPEAYQELRRLWMSHMEARPADVQIAGSVGKYFQLSDRELAERGFLRALEIDPRNGEYQWRLGFFYGLAVLGVDALAFNGQPASIDPFAQDSPFTAKVRKELATSASPLLVAVAGNVIARYGTMLAASERTRLGHLEEAERLYRRAIQLDPNNPSWKQMLQETQALKVRMQVSNDPPEDRPRRKK